MLYLTEIALDCMYLAKVWGRARAPKIAKINHRCVQTCIKRI